MAKFSRYDNRNKKANRHKTASRQGEKFKRIHEAKSPKRDQNLKKLVDFYEDEDDDSLFT